MKVRWSLDKATLWVGDLDASVTTEVLRAAFTQFGNVLACRVIRKPEELGFAHQGFGFVDTPEFEEDLGLRVHGDDRVRVIGAENLEAAVEQVTVDLEGPFVLACSVERDGQVRERQQRGGVLLAEFLAGEGDGFFEQGHRLFVLALHNQGLAEVVLGDDGGLVVWAEL